VDRRAGVEQVARILGSNRISLVPVVSGSGRVLGVVTESDLLFGAVLGRRRPFIGGWFTERTAVLRRRHGMVADDVMAAPVVTVHAEQTVIEAARIAARARVRRLPVVDDRDHLVGIVTRLDLRRCFLLGDAEIRDYLLTAVLGGRSRPHFGGVTADVVDGVVALRGQLETSALLMPLLRRLRGVAGIAGVRVELEYHSDVRASLHQRAHHMDRVRGVVFPAAQGAAGAVSDETTC
jgi:CBS domain-containing protein